MAEDARTRLAYLIWCWDHGYRNAEDRAITSNWLLDDTLHPDDAVEREQLLAAADEILALMELGRTQGHSV
jgi:hypothetical protein